MPPKGMRNYPAKSLGNRDWLLTTMRIEKPAGEGGVCPCGLVRDRRSVYRPLNLD
jgi:hypothetical protein